MEKVYLESSFISYLVSKPSQNLIVAANQRITWDWWEIRRNDFECYISETVLDEILRGDEEEIKKRCSIVRDLQILPATEDVKAITRLIMQKGILPLKASTDAVHISMASFYKIDYLLTWNCKHLANAQVSRRIQTVLVEQGIMMPYICTPVELLGENYDV